MMQGKGLGGDFVEYLEVAMNGNVENAVIVTLEQ
jgi:hypothetical protein